MEVGNEIIAKYYPPHSYWGQAISSTYEKEDGTLWVTNGEYGSQVNFCPITGYEAKIKIETK